MVALYTIICLALQLVFWLEPNIIANVVVFSLMVRTSRRICGVVSDLPKQRLCRSQTTYQTNGSFLGLLLRAIISHSKFSEYTGSENSD